MQNAQPVFFKELANFLQRVRKIAQKAKNRPKSEKSPKKAKNRPKSEKSPKKAVILTSALFRRKSSNV
jgi:hypothetical protein